MINATSEVLVKFSVWHAT